jgi:cytochrome c oxidase subunit I+III
MATSLAMYLFNVVVSLRRGERAGDNPWNAATLEWATSSPPPPYNFAPLRTVSGRDPLWHPDPEQPVVVGIASDKREVLVTHVMDAEPDHRPEESGPSIWPLFTSVAVTGLFIGSIFTPWAVVYGSVPVFVTLVAWFWPREGYTPDELEQQVATGQIRPEEQTS